MRRGVYYSVGKHAYLIMVHTQFQQVAKLVRLIDDSENDIYLHIDKKVQNAYEIFQQEIKPIVKKSNIYFVLQHKVNWGGYSQIETEIELLKTAAEKKYDYYHLLSGADLPLKTQREVHEFFEKNKGKEFVQLGTKEYIREVRERFQYYWFWQEYLGNGKGVLKNILCKIRYGIVLIQKFIGVDRIKNFSNNLEYAAGANWFSITHGLVEYILTKQKIIDKLFRYSLCCDEIFIQTMILNSEFKKNIYHKKFDGSYQAIMRKIDWERGNPYVWNEKDYDELINSEYLFARKFDENVDKNIIDKIYGKLVNELL